MSAASLLITDSYVFELISEYNENKHIYHNNLFVFINYNDELFEHDETGVNLARLIINNYFGYPAVEFCNEQQLKETIHEILMDIADYHNLQKLTSSFVGNFLHEFYDIYNSQCKSNCDESLVQTIIDAYDYACEWFYDTKQYKKNIYPMLLVRDSFIKEIMYYPDCEETTVKLIPREEYNKRYHRY